MQASGAGRPSGRVTRFREALHRDGALRDVFHHGRRYCLADLGEGPPVVLVHGLGGSLYDWRHLLRPLAERHRVLAPDLLGAGESDHPSGADYSVAAQAERLCTLMDRIGVGRAAWVGNSYGGGVLLQLAQEEPERVDRLVLLNSVCYADRVPAYVTLAKAPFAGLLAEWVPLGKATRWALGKGYPTVAALTAEEFETYQQELRRPGRRRVLVEVLRSIVPPDVPEFERRLRGILAPALLIWGVADRTIPVDLGRRLVKDLPNARLVELDAGHVPNQERPDEVLHLLREFLA